MDDLLNGRQINRNSELLYRLGREPGPFAFGVPPAPSQALSQSPYPAPFPARSPELEKGAIIGIACGYAVALIPVLAGTLYSAGIIVGGERVEH